VQPQNALAAYDTKSDRFLILDVARYKYPPVWVKASELFDAMNTADADNEEKTRGFVLISKPDRSTRSYSHLTGNTTSRNCKPYGRRY
jgi:Phytochelatin synthase